MNYLPPVFLRLIDLLMVSRPVVIIPVWGFCALGLLNAFRINSFSGLTECWHYVTITVYLWIMVFSLSVASVYVMNQIADIEADKRNGGLPLIAQNIVSISQARFLAVLYGFFSLFLPLFLKKHTIFLMSFIALLLGYIYSFKPLRLSGRPFLDFITNALGYGIVAFGVGWTIAGKSLLSSAFLINSLPYFLMMCGGSISSTIPDIEGDMSDCKKTTAVYLGAMNAHKLATGFVLLAAISGILLNDTIAVICTLACLPLYFLYFFKKNRILMEATYKGGGALCMIAAFTGLPLFIIIAIVVFLSTWLYYRIRHGVSYPALVPLKIQK